jgi:hypothetical protein
MLGANFGFEALAPKQRQQNDDRQGYAEQPEQCASSEAHFVRPFY